MIPRQYLQDSKYQLSELFHSLTSKEKEVGLNLLREMGKEKLGEWINNNEEEVKKYILSTPAQRGKKKKWNEDISQRFLLIYFSANYVERAINFLKVMDDNEIYLNESYHEMTYKAFEIFSDIQLCDVFYDTLFKEELNL